MTGSDVRRVPFTPEDVTAWALDDPRHQNWPVVYTLDGPKHVYVGESVQAGTRLRHHVTGKRTVGFTSARVIMDDTFNKSVCLDLESYLIRMFAGDGRYAVTNANAGLTESDYYDRDGYRSRFKAIFEELRADGLFERGIEEIENSDLFKLSPFKALTLDQREAVLSIVVSMLVDLDSGEDSRAVVSGGPGTGKTVVAIFLMKLLADIASGLEPDEDGDALLVGLFTPANTESLTGLRMGLVVPQQSLRATVKRVFRQTPGLHPRMVLSPYEAVRAVEQYDLLIVDEAHRLQQLSATLPTLITAFKRINRDLFGDERGGDQLDWIERSSRHSILMVDALQTVRPADLPTARLTTAQSAARDAGRHFVLRSQMRMRAGEDYVGYVRALLRGETTEVQTFEGYELVLFDDLTRLRTALRQRERDHGLARLVAGYAWKWRSKTDPEAVDIEIGDERLQWNRTSTDWISSATSVDEVGSIHTVQGYDLNYAGVIIGPDLRHDPVRGLYVDRSSYFDTKGKANNAMLGITYDDEALRTYITNIYAVLMTRGILGTFVYVCDPGLREHLQCFLPGDGRRVGADLRWPRAGAVQYTADLRDSPGRTPEQRSGRPSI